MAKIELKAADIAVLTHIARFGPKFKKEIGSLPAKHLTAAGFLKEMSNTALALTARGRIKAIRAMEAGQ